MFDATLADNDQTQVEEKSEQKTDSSASNGAVPMTVAVDLESVDTEDAAWDLINIKANNAAQKKKDTLPCRSRNFTSR